MNVTINDIARATGLIRKSTQKQDEIIAKNRKNDFCPMILLEKLLRMR